MSGKLTLISSATASDSASVEFTSGIDSTYDEYVFYFVDIFSRSGSSRFRFQANASGGSGFNETITSSFFYAYHSESGSTSTLMYQGAYDQAQGTSYQPITGTLDNAADNCGVGELHLFSPSSTSKVKHFYATANNSGGNYSNNVHVAGYINQTSAIDEIAFNVTSGNFDGNIYLFGVS